MKSMPHVKNRSDVLMWRKHRSIWSCCQITVVSIFMLSSCISQASFDLLSQRASDCPSQLGQTTCTLLWNTPSRCCGPSQSACGCDPQREESGRLCLTLFLHNPMNWCCCKACIPPLSCSSMTRSVKLHRNWPVHCLGAIDLPKEVYVMLYGSNVKLFIDYILSMSNAMYAKEIIISNYRNYWIFRIIVHCIKQNISRLNISTLSVH